VKLLQQIKGDVRLMFHQCIADHIQLIVETDGIDVVAHLLERRANVVFSFDLYLVFVTEAVERIGGHEILMDQNNNAKLLFGFESHRAVKPRYDDNPNAVRS
jgi:hypothetical protein